MSNLGSPLFIIIPVAVVGLIFIVLCRQRHPLSSICGPKSPSFIFGHLVELNHHQVAGELEYQWIHEHGDACTINGSFGQKILLLADPKALHHIFQISGYRYPKPEAVNQSIMLMMGRGIFSAVGHNHKRHKKIMNPAFELSRIRSFLPLFHNSVKKLSAQWEIEINRTNGHTPLNVYTGISRMMLDNIGEAAFEYQFKMLDGGATGELTDAFTNILADSLLFPDKGTIFFTSLWRFIPPKLLRVIEYLPVKQVRRLRHFLRVSKEAAKQVVERRMKQRDSTEDKKDMLSILVRSNLSADEKKRLDEDELLSQMATIMFAGHDSTSNGLTWLLHDLAYNPKDQERLREEITRIKSRSSNPDELTIPELESMQFTNAVMRESLRLHPIAFALPRMAIEDDIIPLATPIKTTVGSYKSEIAIRKGQHLHLSVYTYNRLQSVWGPDANEWNPERFLDSEARKEYQLGMFANLLTFSGGVRGCIGWRFAILELQATLIGLIEKFNFSPVPGIEVQGAPAGSMIPIVKGRAHEGSQMPLYVSVLN